MSVSISPFLQPTEYYDERNAMEERLGQVSMDDLASEGLLLIRIQPDVHGRYGFIVKVGVRGREVNGGCEGREVNGGCGKSNQ